MERLPEREGRRVAGPASNDHRAGNAVVRGPGGPATRRPSRPIRKAVLLSRLEERRRLLRLEPRDFFVGYEQLNASRLAWSATNQSEALELDDHAMNGWRRDTEEGLHVGFGWRPTIEQGVGVDEGEVLPLRLGEPRLRLGDRHADVPMIDGPEGSHHERTVPHHVDVGGA